MTELEPFVYIASTNLKEHNDFVKKINEIIGVVKKVDPSILEAMDAKMNKMIFYVGKDTDLIPNYPF